MTNPLQCPKCLSTNVIVSDKTLRHLCETCGYDFTGETAAKPLRIFLSYGHDENEELVRRIKTDLEARGHDVWFDKEEIKFGDEWRRKIADGIDNSDKVLSFLSKHSTRDPGVCLDEIAIAIGVKGGNIQTVLVESEPEVKPPASISHIQWLDMHDWKERRKSASSIPPEQADSWENWYQGKLSEIVRVVESEESQRFAGEIETLNVLLKPISSDSRISLLLGKGFVGREWLFDAVESWRNPKSQVTNPQLKILPSRLFWITGDPGVGKSAFAAHLTHFGRDRVIAAQFVEWDKPDHRDAARVIRSLAFQLANRLPDYRKRLLTLPEITKLDRKNPAELFDYLLTTPLQCVIDGGRERYLIVIDALDEASENGRNPLVEMLARHAPRLPEWLGIVVTSRPNRAVTGPFQGLNPLVLDTRTEANRDDLRRYLSRSLAPQLAGRADTDQIIERILEKSEGVFLYAEHVCAELAPGGNLTLDRLDQFPQGLGGIYHEFFTRQFPDIDRFRRTVRPALRAILAAREPLPVELLQKLFDWEAEELHDFTRSLGSLFSVTKTAYSETIKPCHKSVHDWLTDATKAGEYFVSELEGHRLLGEHCEKLMRSLDGQPSVGIPVRYASQYILAHYVLSRRWEQFLACVSSPLLFGNLMPSAYGIDFEYGGTFASAESVFSYSFLDESSEANRTILGLSLANAIGLRSQELLARYIVDMRKHNQVGVHEQLTKYLKANDPSGWCRLRDLVYLIPLLSDRAAELALKCNNGTSDYREAIGKLCACNAKVVSFCRYLADNHKTLGWSAAVADLATGCELAWSELTQMKNSGATGQ